MMITIGKQGWEKNHITWRFTKTLSLKASIPLKNGKFAVRKSFFGLKWESSKLLASWMSLKKAFCISLEMIVIEFVWTCLFYQILFTCLLINVFMHIHFGRFPKENNSKDFRRLGLWKFKHLLHCRLRPTFDCLFAQREDPRKHFQSSNIWKIFIFWLNTKCKWIQWLFRRIWCMWFVPMNLSIPCSTWTKSHCSFSKILNWICLKSFIFCS